MSTKKIKMKDFILGKQLELLLMENDLLILYNNIAHSKVEEIKRN